MQTVAIVVLLIATVTAVAFPFIMRRATTVTPIPLVRLAPTPEISPGVPFDDEWFARRTAIFDALDRDAPGPTPLRPVAQRKLSGIARSEARMAAEFWMWHHVARAALKGPLAEASVRETENSARPIGRLEDAGLRFTFDDKSAAPDPRYGDAATDDLAKAELWYAYVQRMPERLADLQRCVADGEFDAVTARLMDHHTTREWETYRMLDAALERELGPAVRNLRTIAI